jgi:hypothetical protein
MTAPDARQPRVLPRPACTSAAIRAVLAANADGDILQRYDKRSGSSWLASTPTGTRVRRLRNGG